MTDDADVPLHGDADADVDPADLSWAAEALAGLDFLTPDADLVDEPMPAWVWARVESTLAAERRAGEVTVTAVNDRRPSRALRWGGGFAAASVAVLAVGVGVTAFRGAATSGGAVVAGEVTVASASMLPAAAGAPADAKAAPSAQALGAPPSLSADTLAQPQQLNFAGMVPPALRLVDSKTDYTSRDLKGQVSDVMDGLGLAPETTEQDDLATAPTAMPMPTADARGFISSAQRLRDCITRLTHADTSTALLVDMSSYEGRDAAVVVANDYPEGAASSPDMSQLEVWVVDPECVRPITTIRIEISR